MKILKAIEKADMLCPNKYSLEEKLEWCDELGADLRRNIIKEYETIETYASAGGEITLPDGLDVNNIECVFIGNTLIEKQDFRSFMTGAKDLTSGSKKLRLVCLKPYERIRTTEIKGDFNTGVNFIEINVAPFVAGDKIQIAEYSESGALDYDLAPTSYVLEVQPDKIILEDDVLTPKTGASMSIRRVITDDTEVDYAPYDSMYVEFLLAKMALYQHDYVGYNAHMVQYNSLYEGLRRDYKTRNPLMTITNFKNYSRV